jgi:hypothetical protein
MAHLIHPFVVGLFIRSVAAPKLPLARLMQARNDLSTSPEFNADITELELRLVDDEKLKRIGRSSCASVHLTSKGPGALSWQSIRF